MSLSSSKDTDFNEHPNLNHEICSAKSYLQQRSPDFKKSLYDHLSELLCILLSERPKDPYAVFEKYSIRIKNENFTSEENFFRNIDIPPLEYEFAKKIIKFFQSNEEEPINESINNESFDQLQDFSALFYNFQRAGVSLSQSEILLLDLSIRDLLKKVPIENVRFWGKIFGTSQNYYIVEANLQDSELENRLEILDEKHANIAIEEDNSATDYNKQNLKTLNPENESIYEIPAERLGSGANANVYFVCNCPGLDDWIELPPVTPQQIIISRQIVRYFTGNLDNEIITYPPFPGTEKNYLRAQIARISATTLISPVGYFKFTKTEDDEEETENEEIDESDVDIILEQNEEYNPPEVKDLLDPLMSHWCHHSLYLHEQGRLIPWISKKSSDNEIKDLKGNSMIEENTWSYLFTPLSKDIVTHGILPWSTRLFSKIRPESSVVLVRSNMWPGAYAYAAGRQFGNIYIGWGHKITANNFKPLKPTPVITDDFDASADFEMEEQILADYESDKSEYYK